MTLVFQLIVFALIATSLILLIKIPVVFASPNDWSSNKNVIFSGTSLWIGLVFFEVSLILSFLETICPLSKTKITPLI